MNKYAKYLKELKGYEMYEDEHGFITYGIMQDNEHKFMYIEDIYVIPEKRKSNIASEYANYVEKKAKEANCSALLGSVVPSLRPDSHYRMLVLLGYGFKLHSSQNDIVYFYKEI
jgi:ribosomal protein S18 acetylase RimI-like enzyme